jgi:hypothetical protein
MHPWALPRNKDYGDFFLRWNHNSIWRGELRRGLRGWDLGGACIGEKGKNQEGGQVESKLLEQSSGAHSEQQGIQ